MTSSLDGRFTANCLAHARGKYDELVKANASEVAKQAIQRIAWLDRVEADAKVLTTEQRLQMRLARYSPAMRWIACLATSLALALTNSSNFLLA